MRIDDDDRKIGRDKRMDLIRRYQEEQTKLDQVGMQSTKPEEATKVDNTNSGTSRAAEAVDAAHKQQSQGESWAAFEAHKQTAEVPESVEEKAQAEKAQLERVGLERQAKDRQSVRELQNEMAVRQRRIRS